VQLVKEGTKNPPWDTAQFAECCGTIAACQPGVDLHRWASNRLDTFPVAPQYSLPMSRHAAAPRLRL
jgi:hypothetical protein